MIIFNKKYLAYWFCREPEKTVDTLRCWRWRRDDVAGGEEEVTKLIVDREASQTNGEPDREGQFRDAASVTGMDTYDEQWTVLQSQKAVSAYFTSKQIPPFGFARQPPSKTDMLAQCWFNVCPPPATVIQWYASIGPTCNVCWDFFEGSILCLDIRLCNNYVCPCRPTYIYNILTENKRDNPIWSC